jgi:2-polyprenyl-6-methoxyphenol hydroxylase-like FAD-dependent oxidoreductase
MDHKPICICGAGPTGLVLALWLTKRNIPLRIIDKAEKPGTASRALAVHARTLEFYRQMGIDTAVIDSSIEFQAIHLWLRQKEKGTLLLNGAAEDISAFPYVRIFPQDEHEALLEKELCRLGVHVERGTELVALQEMPGGVRLRLKKKGEPEEIAEASYLAGCDGARSFVREKIGAGFPGGTYSHTFYVADIAAQGAMVNRDLNLALDESDFLAIFPLKEKGRVRLVGAVRDRQNSRNPSPSDEGDGHSLQSDGNDPHPLQWSDVSQDIFRRLDLEIKEINWFSTYRVHHRVTDHFRIGRVFLLGDAAHVHSPVGGQGMNTGIGDAVNLAWKLEAVLRDGAPDALLDTYESERIKFARRLVASTDRAFSLADSRGVFASGVRTRLVPNLFPVLFKRRAVRRLVFRMISQTGIHYRDSALSEGSAHGLRGGDRLPWLMGQDNYTVLQSMDWQMHCYGEAPQELSEWCMRSSIPLHVFRPAGVIGHGAICLVRPDGHIGWIGNKTMTGELTRYVHQWRIA